MTKIYSKAVPAPAVQVPLTNADTLRFALNDLYTFSRTVMGHDLLEEQPHRALCEFFEEDYPRKLMVGARGMYKTTIGSVDRPVQLALKNSSLRHLIVQQTIDNARNTVGQIRDHFDNNSRLRLLAKMLNLLPRNTRVVPWSDSALQLNRNGIFGEPTFTAAGIETNLATRHYDYIFADDPVSANPDDMKRGGLIIIQPEQVEKAIGWYRMLEGLSIKTRKQEQKTYIQVIVNRWAMQDFASFIMENHLQDLNNLKGFKYYEISVRDKEGRLTWPTVYSEEELARIRAVQGEFIYWTQYECKPHDPAHRGFPAENNVWYEGDFPPDADSMQAYAVMDMGDKLQPAHCPTGMVVVFVDKLNHLWVNEDFEQRVDPSKKIDLMYRVLAKYPHLHNTFHIEQNLHDETLQWGLRNEMKLRGHFRVNLVKTHNQNWQARILRLQPHHERRAIHLNRKLKFIPNELRDFPHSNFVDALDALGHIMAYVRQPYYAGVAGTAVADPSFTIKDLKDLVRAGQRPIHYGKSYSLQTRPARARVLMGA